MKKEYKNVPESIFNSVMSQPNTTLKEKEEILIDLEKQFINRKERQKKHEESMKNEEYRKFYKLLNNGEE